MLAAISNSVSGPVDVIAPFDVVAAAAVNDDAAPDEDDVDSVVTVMDEFDNK